MVASCVRVESLLMRILHASKPSNYIHDHLRCTLEAHVGIICLCV